MVDTFGDALRGLRIAAGFRSLAAFATKMNYSKGYLGNIETGERQPTPDLAEACDRALGTAPLLSMLLEDPGGNDAKRRALLSSIRLVTGAGAVVGPSALADLVRHGFLDTACDGEDWDAVVDSYGRRFVVDPSPQFGASLLTQLLVLRQKIAENRQNLDLHRAAAGLGQFYGLWLGNQGELPTAHNWYRTAAVLADRSGDLSLRSFVRGRSLARDLYEGYAVKQTLDGVGEVLSLTSTPNSGALKAHAARVCLYALTGNASEGRKAVNDMRAVVDDLSTMRAIKHDVQVIAIAARDAVSAVPDGYRSDEFGRAARVRRPEAGTVGNAAIGQSSPNFQVTARRRVDLVPTGTRHVATSYPLEWVDDCEDPPAAGA